MDFTKQQKAVTGVAAGQYFKALQILHEKHDIKGTALIRRGIAEYCDDFKIDIDKL